MMISCRLLSTPATIEATVLLCPLRWFDQAKHRIFLIVTLNHPLPDMINN